MRFILTIAVSILPLFTVCHPTHAFSGVETCHPNDEITAVPSGLEQAVRLYNAGWSGNDHALIAAIERLEELMKLHPGSPLVRAYYGSACIAYARMVPDRRKSRWLRRGEAELEAAARAAPSNVKVRILRARSFSILPRMSGRIERVEEDLAWLLERANEEGKLTPACRQAIYYQAGAFALRNRDSSALELLQKAAEIDSGKIIRQEEVTRMLELAREHLPHNADDRYDE